MFSFVKMTFSDLILFLAIRVPDSGHLVTGVGLVDVEHDEMDEHARSSQHDPSTSTAEISISPSDEGEHTNAHEFGNADGLELVRSDTTLTGAPDERNIRNASNLLQNILVTSTIFIMSKFVRFVGYIAKQALNLRFSYNSVFGYLPFSYSVFGYGGSRPYPRLAPSHFVVAGLVLLFHRER